MKRLNWFAAIALTLTTVLTHAQAATEGWGRWTKLNSPGVYFGGDPDMCSDGNYAHVVARATDGTIRFNSFIRSSQRWGVWENLGGQMRSAPSIVCSAYRIDVFATDTSGFIKWKSYFTINNTWTPWRLVDGIDQASAPAAILRDASTITLYVRTDYDNSLYTITGTDGQWGQWVRMGGVFTGDPSAIFYRGRNPVTRTDWTMIRVVVNRSPGWIMETFSYKYNENDPDQYSFWSDSGRRITSSPEITVDPNGRYDYWGRNQNNTLGHSWNGFGNWESLGGILAGKPSAAWLTASNLVATIRGNDNNLYYRVFNR